MNKKREANQEELKTIVEIAVFSSKLLSRHGHVLIDTGDGALFNFVKDDWLGDDDVLTWCFATASLCGNHELNFQSRKKELERLGLKTVPSETDIMTYEGELVVDSIDSDIRRLLLAGFEAGETDLKLIEVNSVNHESDLFQIETHKFLTHEEEGGE